MVDTQNLHLKRSNDQTLEDIAKKLPKLQETINKQRNFLESLRNDKKHQVSKFLTDKIMRSSLLNAIAKGVPSDSVEKSEELKELELIM